MRGPFDSTFRDETAGGYAQDDGEPGCIDI